MKTQLKIKLLTLSFLVLTFSVHAENIRVFSFNIQIFGQAKMKKPDVVNILSDIVQLSDVIAIQEVRSASLEPVEIFMNRLPAHYSYVIGPRVGRTSSKEQFWVIYDTRKLRVLAVDTWEDPDDIYERDPFAVFFQTKSNFDFILLNNHIQPRRAPVELRSMGRVVDYYQRHWNEKDVLIVGDFNADGSYFDESLIDEIFPPEQYRVVITNEYDTSVSAASNTYDRIIITNYAVEDWTGNAGVLRFEELYNFEQYPKIRPSDISDHYPIWAEFDIDSDSD